jgi:hypothetical protein
MATAFTWETLQTAIEAHLEDDGADFTDSIATIIALGEDKCVKALDFEMWYVVDATKVMSQGDPLLSLPTGSLRIGDIAYTSGSTKVPLVQRTYSYCLDYAASGAQVAPKFWAPYSETQIYLAGVPNAAYPVTMKHLKRPTGLSASNTTTWLSTNLGDLLLYGCLSAAEAFLLADERVPLWESKYGKELEATLRQFRSLVHRD